MSVFQAGQVLTAAALNSAAPLGAAQTAVNTGSSTTTSTSYVDAVSGAGLTTLGFVAPASGAIKITISAAMDNSGSFYTNITFRISGAAGTVNSLEENSAQQFGTDDSTRSKTTVVTGLVPGSAGTITMTHRVTGGTGTYDYRSIIWEPIPA